jgi:hypothetical protein
MMTLHTPQPGRRARRRKESGALMTDLVVGLAIFALALLPLAVSFVREFQLVRASYWRSLAMEIVDGEMEILAAGEWRAVEEGASAFVAHAPAVTNLPPGQFQLTKSGGHLRLEWTPETHRGVGAVIREVTVK